VSPLRALSPPEEHRSLPDITASIGILHLLHVKIYLPNSHMVVSSGVSLSEAIARQPATLALQLTVVVTDTSRSLDVSSCLHRFIPTCLASLSAVIQWYLLEMSLAKATLCSRIPRVPVWCSCLSGFLDSSQNWFDVAHFFLGASSFRLFSIISCTLYSREMSGSPSGTNSLSG
jgi:hypothetical protein